jgi:WD40 repeat protein
VKHMCRSSGAEIYDLAWSPDAVYFIIGSMDNIGRIYNAQTGISICIFRFDVQLTAFRPTGSTNRRAQSLRSRRGMGSLERLCCNSVLRSLGTHILIEN